MSTVAMAAAAAGSALTFGAAGFGAARYSLRRRLQHLRGELVKAQHEAIAARVEAKTDRLTGMWNRAGLAEELDFRVNSDAPFVVLMVDLDGFKEINDELGHDIGDEVLVEVAGRLERLAGDAVDGYAARLGGDEFVLVAELPAPDFVLPWARAVADGLAEPIDVDLLETVQVRASVGAMQGWLGDDPSMLLRGADLAMFAAKAAGGDGAAEFDTSQDATDFGDRPNVRTREVGHRVRIEHRMWAAERLGVIA